MIKVDYPIVDVCFLSSAPGASYVMAREDGEPVGSSRRLPITVMYDADGDETADPREAVSLAFGSEDFGWCTYQLTGPGPEALQ